MISARKFHRNPFSLRAQRKKLPISVHDIGTSRLNENIVAPPHLPWRRHKTDRQLSLRHGSKQKRCLFCGRRQQLTYKESSRKYSVMEASSVDELMKQLKEGMILVSTLKTK